MKKTEQNIYRCPCCAKELTLTIKEVQHDNVISGSLDSHDSLSFVIDNGTPDLTWPKELADIDKETRETYNNLADNYDLFADIPFKTFKSDESEVRRTMVDKLNITSESIVLEIGAGDGRSSEHIAQRLGPKGKLYVQELSRSFLEKAIKRLAPYNVATEFSVANGCFLPFKDNMFDAAHHFGGINTFSDVARCLGELIRVVRPGGKVVLGDESMAPWLRNTEFGKIMTNSNPLFNYEIPFNKIPVEARDVKVEWILMGAFFVLEFSVGEGAPEGNYHIQIPSKRGGSHWTRYYGSLEGVTDATKKLAYEAQQKSGKSMHKWLDDIVKKAARGDLSW